MTREQKSYLELELRVAKRHIKKVWVKTANDTPEDSIASGIICSINALLKMLELVKTED